MKRILTVDDSASMRKMVSFTLTGNGFEVIETTDGLEALTWAKVNPAPDLIISDINMPNMDGISLTKALRELTPYRFIPILILTTESSQEIKIKGKEAGATGWIVKPFNPEQLISVIQRVIES